MKIKFKIDDIDIAVVVASPVLEISPLDVAIACRDAARSFHSAKLTEGKKNDDYVALLHSMTIDY